MIYFEPNILYPIDYKQSSIDLPNNKALHYRISTNTQQNRWWISVVTTENGQVTQRNDLSKLFNQYDQVLTYISGLQNKLFNESTEQVTNNRIEEMRKDFYELCNKQHEIISLFNRFKARYL